MESQTQTAHWKRKKMKINAIGKQVNGAKRRLITVIATDDAAE